MKNPDINLCDVEVQARALEVASRRWLDASDAHCKAARGALERCILQVQEVAAGGLDGGWAEAEVVAEDGVKLTCGGTEPDGRVRHRWRMPTSVALERAERTLRQAVVAAPPGVLRDAAQDLLAELKEPIFGYRPDVPEEVARDEARWERHRGVRSRLRRVLEEPMAAPPSGPDLRAP